MMIIAFKDRHGGFYQCEVESDDDLPAWTQGMTRLTEAQRLAEITAPQGDVVPQLVTMRQARLALHAAGLLAAVDAAVEQAGGAAQIEWEYAHELRRDHPLISTLKPTLGLTDAQLDELFAQASEL